MDKCMVVFETMDDRYSARDLINSYIDSGRVMRVMTRPTKDGREVKVFDKKFMTELDDQGIAYRRVGLDELRHQMTPKYFGVLEDLILRDGW